MVEITRLLSPKYINIHLFTLILYGVGVRCDVDIFKLTASAQSIYREVYDQGKALPLNAPGVREEDGYS